MHNKQFISRNRQRGFIQNFIIPGIILIGVVIAGIAMLSSGSSSSTDNEKSSMLANAVMAQSLGVAEAIQRAEADGAIAASATGSVNLTNTAVAGKYLAALPAPSTEVTAGTNLWTYTKADLQVSAGGSDLGTTAKDDVLQITMDGAVAEAVCLRINNKLYSTSTLAGTATGGTYTAATSLTAPTGAPVGALEGCVKSGSDYIYYKTINVK